MVKKVTKELSYTEEDGFLIMREGIAYMVYGTAEGEYVFTHEDESRDCPANDEVDEDDFDCWLDHIEQDGVSVDIELTDDEWNSFENYMQEKLKEQANNFDDWEDEEDDRIAAAEEAAYDAYREEQMLRYWEED